MLHGIVLAGGVGERFWPLSTPERPKQLLPLLGRRSLLQETVHRLSPLIPSARLIVITSHEIAGAVRRHLPALARWQVVAEPAGKNTAPAIALGCLLWERRAPGAVVAVFPADHHIPDRRRLQRLLRSAATLAEGGDLITFGIRPRSPATGYGYIEQGEPLAGARGGAFRVRTFREKPDARTARRYLARGTFLWNSGIFVWKARALLEEIEEQMPSLHRALQRLAPALGTSRERQALEAFYRSAPRISIDYGLLERSRRVAVIPARLRWLDIGSWAGLAAIGPRRADGVTVRGTCLPLETRDSVLVADQGLVATLGVRDLIVVRTAEATLVCDRSRGEEVRRIVAALRGWRGAQAGRASGRGRGRPRRSRRADER